MRNILDYFRRPKTAAIAKDRLHIIIAQERTESSRPDYLPLLKQEILAVVAKYMQVDLDQVNVELHHNNNNSVLELNVLLPTPVTEADPSAVAG